MSNRSPEARKPVTTVRGSRSRSGPSASQQLPDLTERISGLTEANRQLRRKIFDLYTIFEISRDFNSVLDYHQLLDTFILTSLAQVSASRAAIFLPGENVPDRFVLTRHKGSGPIPGRRQYFKADSKVLTYLANLNRPLPTAELLSSAERRGERSILTSFDPGLVVPLIFQARLRGVLLIADKIQNRPFSPDDIEFLSVLGNQISVAIENSRLYEAERQTARQLQAAQQQLVVAERLAALGEMSAKVAHEVNNPLGIIKNYLQLVRRAVGHNVEACNYTDIVGQEIDRIARIVRELLDFHRPATPDFKPTQPVGVIDDVLTLMSRKFESCGVQVVRDYQSECPTIEAVAENLKQVFLNVLLNAADSMPNGGLLEVKVRYDSKKITVCIDDTGPGLPPELIPRIFEPFFTTKEPGQGTGLGLSVCYGIIKRHRGSITFNNTDRGGRITIVLPRRADERADN